jgi:hypothetical protein
MALRAKRKEAIRIPVSEFVKDFLTLPDVEPLTLKLFDECIPNLTNCAVRVLLALRGRDHLPKQHPCEIVPARTSSHLGLIANFVLALRLLCIPLLLRLHRHHFAPLSAWSLIVPIGHASDKQRFRHSSTAAMSRGTSSANAVFQET